MNNDFLKKSSIMKNKRIKILKFSFKVLLFLIVSGIFISSAFAATVTWNTTTSNWSSATVWTGGEPGSGDVAYIDNGGNAIITAADEVCNQLRLGWGVGDSGTVNIGGTGVLTTSSHAYIGGHGTGTIYLTFTGTLDVNNNIYLGYYSDGNGIAYFEGNDLIAQQLNVGYNGEGGVSQTNSDVDLSGALYLGFNSGALGQYYFSGDNLSCDAMEVGHSGDGFFRHSGGIVSVAGSFYVAYDTDTTGTYLMNNAGASLSSNTQRIGDWGTGIFNQTRGTNTVSTYIVLGSNSGSSGTYYLGDASATGSINGAGDLRVREVAGATGLFQGWGDVNLTGDLINNEKIIADGYGTERTLAMDNFNLVTNTLDNTTSNGWYAQNKGVLSLPAIAVNQLGDDEYNWGEQPADTTIDLVNSVRMEFTDITTTGDLSIDLYALDHPDAYNNGNLVGVWDFDPSTIVFDTVKLIFRFDDILATSLMGYGSVMEILHYEGGQWVPVTDGAGFDWDTKTVWANATSFSMYAVGVSPEPSTIILFLLGFVGLGFGWWKRKGQSAKR